VPGKVAEYNHSLDTACSSGPRFRMHEQLKTEDPILIFSPPIKTNADFSDADPSSIINNPGVMAEPQWGLLERVCETSTTEPECSALPPIIRPGIHGLAKKGTNNTTSTANRSSGVFMEGQLVVSTFQHHSAQEVCQSSTSRGPDFVSILEGLHCDMTTRILTAVCSHNTTTCCFDTQANQMRACGVIRGSTKAMSAPIKQYTTVHQWAPPNQ
jgi:hypothetical protein